MEKKPGIQGKGPLEADSKDNLIERRLRKRKEKAKMQDNIRVAKDKNSTVEGYEKEILR